MDQVEAVVIGAGVIGLAVARALALAPELEGRQVLVIEAADAVGTGTSSRNSEVIHGGLYYPQGSLKARFCVEGRRQLYAYCQERGIGHKRCGKLIVATEPDQEDSLRAIAARAQANGVEELQWLGADQARALEPALRCTAALLSPQTGIVDSHGLMLALQGDLENAGGLVALRTALEGARYTGAGFCLRMTDGTEIFSPRVVNAAGLSAPDLARRFEGMPLQDLPRAYYAKGHYFTLAGRAPFSRLIYPVPEAAGLGVHLTLDLAGQAKFGPDVQWVQTPDDLQVDPARGDAFYDQVRRYWPALPDGALQPGYAGIRPKISGPDEASADFRIMGPADHGLPGLVHLMGIESPGLTSCLALADCVRKLLLPERL
jgi:L-2-hydroxyglutarate oxidase LhgO